MPELTHIPSDALQHALADRYAVERELGRGGMGAVYLARDRRLDRPVALEVLPSETLRMLTDVGYALAFAHGRGVVHRDVKPDNIMIERATGRALVMDFGVARTIAAAPAHDGLTRVGEVVGTPEYMSPEQAAGDAVHGRSDLYALGLTAYFALTGTVAMRADSTGKVFFGALLTRFVQTMHEARRLAISGFGASEVHRGLVAVDAEHVARREELRADPQVRRSRRRTVAWAAGLVVVSIGLVRWGFVFRHQIAPQRYQMSLGGATLILVGFVLFAVCVVLLLRSPFKTPLGERLLRWVWIGPLGRALVGFAGRNVAPVPVTSSAARGAPSSAGVGVPPRAADPVIADVVAPPRDPIASLEARVTELERWRREAARS